MLRKTTSNKMVSPKQLTQVQAATTKTGKFRSPPTKLQIGLKTFAMGSKRESNTDDVLLLTSMLKNLPDRLALLEQALERQSCERKKQIDRLSHKLKHSKCRHEVRIIEDRQKSYASPAGRDRELSARSRRLTPSSSGKDSSLSQTNNNNKQLRMKAMEMLIKNMETNFAEKSQKIQHIENQVQELMEKHKNFNANAQIAAVIENFQSKANKMSQKFQRSLKQFQQENLNFQLINKQEKLTILEQMNKISNYKELFEKTLGQKQRSMMEKLQTESQDAKNILKRIIQQEVNLMGDQNKLIARKIQRFEHSLYVFEKKFTQFEVIAHSKNQADQTEGHQNQQTLKIMQQIQNAWKAFTSEYIAKDSSHRTIQTECGFQDVSILMEEKEEPAQNKLKTASFDWQLKGIMEIISGNSTFLEEQIMTIEGSLREVISIINWLVSKINSYF